MSDFEKLVGGNEIYIYIVGIGGLLLLASARLSIFSDNIGKFFASLRRTAQNRDDADIKELKRQVANMEDSNRRRDARDEERRILLEEHSGWDRDMYRVVQQLISERPTDAPDINFDIKFPPPLF